MKSQERQTIRKEIALRMLKSGVSFAEIRNDTLLSLTEIQELAIKENIAIEDANRLSKAQDYEEEIFHLIFSNPNRLRSLYNALGNQREPVPKVHLYEVNSWGYNLPQRKTVLPFIAQPEDLSDWELVAAMHTEDLWHPNYLYEMLFFLTDWYTQQLSSKELYSNEIHIFPSNCCVFYRGGTSENFCQKHYLDEVISGNQSSSLNLCVTSYNLSNKNENWLLKYCPELRAYESFVEKLEEGVMLGTDVYKAVGIAIDACIKENMLTSFFQPFKEKVYDKPELIF